MNRATTIVSQAFEMASVTGSTGELISGLFTPGEIEEFARRLRIVKMLKRGVSQHVIAQKLGVGVATVTRGSKEIQRGRFRGAYYG